MRQALIVSSLAAVYLLVATRWFGISFFDDSMYMTWATWFRPGSLVHQLPYSPLYVLFIQTLGRVIHDPVARYIAVWVVLVMLVSSVPLWTRSRLAWAYTFVLLATPVCYINIYVSLFASIFLLAGISIVLSRNLSFAQSAQIACAACFITSFSRPEYQYSVFLAAIVAVVLILCDRSSPRTTRSLTLRVLSVLALALAIRYPATHSPSNRSGIAFAQHFSVRAAEKGLITEDPWHSNYAERTFGIDQSHNAVQGTATLSDFFRANPRLFLAHALENLRDLRSIRLLAAALILVALPWCVERFRSLRPASLFLILVLPPILASSILIYPRTHYAVIVAPALLFFAVNLLPQRPWLDDPPLRVVLPLGIALILATVTLYEHTLRNPVASQPANITIVRCIRTLERTIGTGDGTLFDTITNRDADVYFSHPRRRLFESRFANWSGLETSLDKQRPAWIIAGYTLPVDYGKTQKQVAAYLTNTLGYTGHPCPGSTGVTIYTRLDTPPDTAAVSVK